MYLLVVLVISNYYFINMLTYVKQHVLKLNRTNMNKVIVSKCA